MRPVIILATVILIGAVGSWPAAAQSELVVVSTANFGNEVAPDSLASVFGEGLSDQTLVAELDSTGQLPETLGGVSVEIGGRKALLLFVSPLQINCLIPAETEIGTVPVEVRGGRDGITLQGFATVRTVATALFSLQGSGQGRGAIQNGVTFTLDPFDVLTKENAGSDKRTRLVIYGTGFRYAGNAARLPEFSNAAPRVSVEISYRNGEYLFAPVEYAGPTPGFFGLDQVNMVLPEELAGAGTLLLRVIAESVPSQRVELTVRSPESPEITEVFPAAGAPGSEMVLRGANLGVSSWTPGKPSRTEVILIVRNQTFRLPALEATEDTVRFLVPALPDMNSGSWYQGAAQVCVEVDSRQTCAPGPISILPAATSGEATGEVLVRWSNEHSRLLSDALRGLGDQQGAEVVDDAARTSESLLRDLISTARAGSPRRVDVQLPDGTEVQVEFDLHTFEILDSLFVANEMGPASLRTKLLIDTKELSFRAASKSCALPEEGEVLQRVRWYRTSETVGRVTDSLYGVVASLSLATCGVALVTCPATAGAACGGCLAALAVYAKAAAIKTVADYSLFAFQKWLDLKPIYLTGIAARPPSIDVAVGLRKLYSVLGDFYPLSVETVVVDAAVFVGLDVILKAANAHAPQITEGRLVTSAIEVELRRLVRAALKEIAVSALDGPDVLAGSGVTLDLTRASLRARDQAANIKAILQLPCANDAGFVDGIEAGEGKCLISGNESVLLFPNEFSSAVDLAVHIGASIQPRIISSKSMYFKGDVVTITGVAFPPRAYVRTVWFGPNGFNDSYRSYTDEAGAFAFSVPVTDRLPTGSYSIRTEVPGNDGTVGTEFAIDSSTVADAAGGHPSVLWVQTQAPDYDVEDSLIVRYRTAAGSMPNRVYDLMLQIYSVRRRNRYYMYDDPTDQHRWIHNTAKPLWQGVPTTDEFRFPPTGGDALIFDEDTPGGEFTLFMYFSEPGRNQPVGNVGVSAIRLLTPAEPICFIATAAFGSPIDPAVSLPRQFRDERLTRMPGGIAFIQAYYEVSPPLAGQIKHRLWLRKAVRAALYPIVLIAAVGLWVHPVAGFLFGLALFVSVIWMFLRQRRTMRWIMIGGVVAAILFT